MEKIIEFNDGKDTYEVPESEAEAFASAVPNARRMTDFVGKDGSRYAVPDDEVEAFRAAVTDVEPVSHFQLSGGQKYNVAQSRMSKFLRSREFREGDAAAREAMRERIDAETPMPDAQGVVSAAAEAAGKGALRTVGKYGGAFIGLGTGPMRAVGSLFGRDNALVKGADWVDDKFDWFAEDLGVGGTSGDKAQDGLSNFGERVSSVAANLMPWFVGGAGSAKIAGKALFAANVAGAGGRSATQMYDELKANGADEETAYLGSLAAGAVSTAASFVFGKLSVENYLQGLAGRKAAGLIASEVKTAGKGFNGIVKNVANGRMRQDIAARLVGAVESGVTTSAEEFVLDVMRQYGKDEDVDFEEAMLKALEAGVISAATGVALAGLRAAEGGRGYRGAYEKSARIEVSQLMADMAPGDIREMNPKKFDEIAKKFARGEGVSRKDANELGLPPSWSKEQRNEVFSEWQAEKAELRRRRAKMDDVQEQALRDDIAGFVGDVPEAQRVYNRVVQNLKDATVLDDPTAREKLIGEAAEAVWNEDKAQRIGAAKGRAKAAERADHDARLAEAERAEAEEAAVRAENDAQERANADALAREENLDNEFMLAREEARANGVLPAEGAAKTKEETHETRTDEALAAEAARGARQPEEGQAPRTTARIEEPTQAEGVVGLPTGAAKVADTNPLPTGAEGVEGASRAPDAKDARPFEERYREWAEEDAPAWAKDLSPEESAKGEKIFADIDATDAEMNALIAKNGEDAVMSPEFREAQARHDAATKALDEFVKAHAPKRGRGRPKKVAAETATPEAKVETSKAETVAEPEAVKPEAPKSAKMDMKPVIAAMHKLGDLAMSDAATLEKALREAEAKGQTDRADNIRTFLDYKKSVGVNTEPKSDKTQGGRYRASIESEKPLDDPKFRAWAKRRGAAPTQQKREEYDAAMVKQATKRLSRWIKGVKVNPVNAISDADLKGDTRAQKIIDAEKHSRAALEEISSGKEFGVLTNEKFGEIKYPLGKTGKGGLGFLHIVEHRMNEGASLQDAIETAYRVGVAAEIGEESRTIYNTHHLDYDGVRAIIAVMPDGSKVITGYKIDADEAAAAIRRAATNKSRSHVSSNEVIGELQKILAQRADGVNSAFSNIRPLRDGKRIVGTYNLKTGEVTLAKGASVETVAHELGWHAAFDWAKRNAATNERAGVLYERMRSFADEAPDAVKAEIAALYGKLDADAFTDEVGAALFVRGQAEQFAGAIDPMVDAPWYKKAWRTVVDIVKDWLSSHGMNRVDLDGVEEMSERRFSEFLATAMLSGKTLGERKGFSMDLDMSKSKKWERKLSDRYEPIKELMERVEGNNGEAYRMARTLEGMAQMGKNRAERAMKRVGKIIDTNDISPELLAQYMQAMAYEERNAKIEKRNRKKDGSGMTQESAEQIFVEIDERGVREKCQEAADILWKLQDEGLQARVDAGLINQETADKWRKEEPHHVPWRDAIDPDTGEWMGRNYMGPEFDTAEGRSTSATGDPVTIMLQEYENAYARAAENALRQNLADIARLNTDVGTIYDSIQVDAKGHRSFIKFPAKGSGEKAKTLAIPDGAKIESTKAGDGGMANILTYRENGETKYLSLNGSLGEAIAAAVTGRSLSRPPAWLSKFMRGYAATATALSPTFAVRNTMADHFDIHGNMVKDFGLLKGEKMYAKMVAEEVKMSKELLQYVHTGDFAHDASGKATTAFGKLIEEYEAAGGLIGGLRTEGYDVIQKRIRADFRSGRNKLRSVGRELAARWTDLQKMSELSTRLAAFKVMKESGMSAKEAAMWSRESTVDFNKKGNWTPVTNILWMFSNSALGSGVRQAKGLLTTKNGLQLATGLAAWGFIEGMLECAMNEGYDDEEEKRGTGTGADLNEYTRQNSAYLRFGDTVYRTNMHMGPYGIIKYAGNVAARVMSGRLTAEKAAKELGLTAAEVAAAFTGMGNVSADAILETGMPTALQPFVQGITGKDYAGRPLYRKKYDEAKPDSSHGRKSTAAGYQWLAKKVNEITGGDEYSKGGIDIAPETVKLITETAGKNFVRDIVNIVQTSVRTLSGENEPRNIPFVRDAVRKVDGNENRYYEALRRYDADKLKFKDPNLKGEERRAFLNAHPWLKSNGKKGSTVVSTLETRIKDLMKKEENPNLSDERKEELKALRRRLQARVIERMSVK